LSAVDELEEISRNLSGCSRHPTANDFGSNAKFGRQAKFAGAKFGAKRKGKPLAKKAKET
jgi:hypothetical protein